jgi:uncharacterized protein YaeQ
MALKATIYKAIINISDLDRQLYLDHTLTLAKHPSENETRLMARLFAWILNANETLSFTKGLSADDEPEIWRKDPGGDIEQWIDVGLPDERRLKKACSRSEQVLLYVYGERPAQVWWQQNKSALARLRHLQVWLLSDAVMAQLTPLCERTMRLQATIQDEEIWLSSDTQNVALKVERWQ